MLDVGHIVDRYAIDRLLGEGGMALVYRVRHTTLHTWHALKVLTLTSRDVRERLIQEGRVQASLNHPNIVAVHDVLDVDGAPGLLMEYIAGPSLDRLLQVYRPTREEALTLFRGICAGIAHAHAKGLIHRDLKPANVMLHVHDHGVTAKVTDFGLAKALRGGPSNRTRTGATMGTPAYMPPEQFRDAGKVDRRADLYALGCILYELLCGRPPFVSADMLELYQAIGAGNYPDPRELVPDLPAPLVRTLEALLATDPAHRVPDCAALLEILGGRTGVTSTFVPAGATLPPAPALGPMREPVTLGPDTPLALAARDLVNTLDEAQLATLPSMRVTSAETWAETREQRAIATLVDEAPVSRPPAPSSPWRTALLTGLALLVLTAGAGLLAGGSALAGGVLALWAQLGEVSPIAIDTEPRGADAGGTAKPEERDAEDAAPAEPVDDPPLEGSADPPPEPSVEPAPVPAPEPVAAPPPKPALGKPQPAKPAPTKPQPAFGRFTFSDADEVVLVGDDGVVYHAGDRLPPGEYRVLASFSGSAEPAPAGRLTLGGGEVASLRCNARVHQCRR